MKHSPVALTVAQAVACSIAWALASSSVAHASPAGGTVVAGEATITGTQTNTVITQTSQNAALNWQSFDIGVGEAVRFVQPNSSAIALNRVLGADATRILGNLSANGKVFLVNPNGVLFGRGANVNVGGLVASTRDLSVTDFVAGRYKFSGTSRGAVTNQGSIHADGGYVALLGANVSNEGVIAARLGTVALASGDALTLDVAGDGLLNVTVNAGSVGALAENGGLIQADGGNVLLTAQSAGGLLPSAVNNTGVIQARSIQNRNGVVRLMGDMTDGTVTVAGTLDASAPDAGDGGFIETSAAHVHVNPGVLVTTAAAHGATGEWLIDPVDYTIAASGGDLTGAALSTLLGSTNVIIYSTSGAAGTSGDVNVDDIVSWSSNTLTLNAQNNININATLNGSGTASLAFEYGQSAVALNNTSTVNVRAPVNLPSGNSLTMKLGSNGSVATYAVINDMTALQAISGNLSGRYALGSDLDASGVANFAPIGTLSAYNDTANQFKGVFDGLGHKISHLTINRPSNNFIGMFGGLSDTGILRNVGLVDAHVNGVYEVGALVSFSYGTVLNSYATGTVSGLGDVGGLIGYQRGGRIGGSWTNVAVTATDWGESAGGITSDLEGAELRDSYALGSVSGQRAGGLVGLAQNGSIINSFAAGSLPNGGGGLIGWAPFVTVVQNSYWDVTKSGASFSDDGGVGLTTTQLQSALPTGFSPAVWGNGGNQTTPYLLGNAGQALIVGDSTAYNVVVTLGQLQAVQDNLSGRYVLGNDLDASGTSSWNGGAGFAPIGNNSTPFAGVFNGLGHTISGLTIDRPSTDYVGLFGSANGATLANIGLADVSITGRTYVGALAGKLAGSSGRVSGSYSTGTVDGFSVGGGLIGQLSQALLAESYSSASIAMTSTAAGGLAGSADTSATIHASYATGSVSAAGNAGALVGTNASGILLSANYWDISTNVGLNPTTGGVGSGSASGTTGLTHAGFLTSASFTPQGSSIGQWNFSDVWVQYEGHTAPLLRAFMTPLTVTVGDAAKGYDGVSYAGNPGVTYSLVPDLSRLHGTILYSGAGVNAGSYALTASGLYSEQTGYAIDYVSGTLTIDPRVLNLSGTRAYDGTNVFSADDLALSGILSGETLSLTGSGTVANKNVGNGKALTLGTLTLNDGTGLASNYTFVGGTQVADITPAIVSVVAVAANKVYDGTTGTTAQLSLTGLVGNETLGVDGAAAFNSKDVASADLVTVSGLTLSDGSSGGLASNYMLASSSATDNASITRKSLTVTGQKAADKIYDGTVAATLSDGSLAGVVTGDTVTLNQTGAFASANVGAGIAINASNSLSGAAATNYALTQPTGLVANITAPPVPNDPTPPASPPPPAPPSPTVSDQYRGAVGWVATNTQVSAPVSLAIAPAPVSAPTVSPVMGSSAGSAGQSYDVPGLNLRVVTRDESLPPVQTN